MLQAATYREGTEARSDVAKRDALTDEQLVQLANRAGLCYPTCWALDVIADAEPERMEHLREFARLILEAHG